MTQTMTLKLTPAQRWFVDSLYRKIDHEPQVLLEHDGAAPRGDFDVIIARLIGRDDELVDEMRLNEPLDVLRTPRTSPAAYFLEAADLARPSFDWDEWRPQSVYATGVLDARHAGDWPVDATFRCRVLALRYRLPPL